MQAERGLGAIIGDWNSLSDMMMIWADLGGIYVGCSKNWAKQHSADCRDWKGAECRAATHVRYWIRAVKGVGPSNNAGQVVTALGVRPCFQASNCLFAKWWSIGCPLINELDSKIDVDLIPSFG
jgi:hypothetical protein